jgi:predicted outer membrane lipoprotein
LILATHIFKLNFGKRFWLRLTLFFLLTGSAGFFSKELPFHWILNFVMAAVFGVILAFLSGLLKLRELFSMVIPSKNKNKSLSNEK